MRRLVLMALAMTLLAVPAAAAATCPPYPGMQNFPAIHSPAEPEDFCWEVSVEEDQELRQIDAWHAAVYWTETEPEHIAWSIEAPAAHDAEGKPVPTTIAVSAENLITLTVHHRAGNPLAGGAPFHYPVVAGTGWEGGFQTFPIEMPPPTVPPPSSPTTAEAPTYCVVPSLRGKSRRAAARALRLANCRLGPVRGENTRGAKVVRQYRRAGTMYAVGTAVGVKLG